jgi:hypothetical protein
MLHRRLARDYETLASSSEALIHLAMIDNVSKRITDESTPTWRGTYWHKRCKSNNLSDLLYNDYPQASFELGLD